MTIGEAGERIDILVDDQNGLTLGLEFLQAIPDFKADQRGKAFGGFIEE